MVKKEGQRDSLAVNNRKKTKGNDRYEAKNTSGISDKGDNNKPSDK